MQTDISHLPQGLSEPKHGGEKPTGVEQLRYRDLMQIAKVSESVYAKRLSFEQIKPSDLVWLDKALEGEYHKITLDDILAGCYTGRFEMWRLPSGIAVTVIQEYPAGKELHCPYLAGIDHLVHLEDFVKDMDRYAKEMGCRWFLCASQRRGLNMLYSKYGKECGTLFLREVP